MTITAVRRHLDHLHETVIRWLIDFFHIRLP